MVSRVKKSKRQVEKSKFKLLINKLSHAGRIALQKVGLLFNSFRGGVQKLYHRFRTMPRVYRIMSIYLLTLLLASGFFIWNIYRLRLIEPYAVEEPPFEWSVYHEDAEQAENEMEEEQEEAVETAVQDPAEAAADPAPEAPVPEPEQTSVEAAWPLRGELFYDFAQMLREKTLYYYSSGIAIQAPAGSEVAAIWDGTVSRVSERGKPHGRTVVLEHQNACKSYYGALGNVQVREGDTVSKGEIIGTVGPGFANEPDYLYLEIIEAGKAVDPGKYLP